MGLNFNLCFKEKSMFPIIYYDTNSQNNHNPNFGSLECGERIKIDISVYEKKGLKIVCPIIKPVYLEICKKIHSDNPIFQYILSKPFKKNILQKIIGIDPSSMKQRNCHGCTMHLTQNICPICGTKKSGNNFFEFAYMLDPNIIDSDTTYITHTSYNAICSAISLVCQMVENKNNGFAIIRPPGHHASNNKSEGFCLVNNVAVCAEYAQQLGRKKIFIFDCDAHHGNGTQNIFYSTNKVFYCSVHTSEAYPKTGMENEKGVGEGEGFNLNIIVPKGINSNDYVEIFSKKVLPVIINYGPDLILVSAGFDGLETDPMKLMKLTPGCYGKITSQLVKLNKQVCMVLEGGYDIENIPKCIEFCINELI